MLVLDVGGVPKKSAAATSPIMHVIHTAYDEDGDVLEVSESIWPADRVILIDDYPIEQKPEEPTAASEI